MGGVRIALSVSVISGIQVGSKFCTTFCRLCCQLSISGYGQMNRKLAWILVGGHSSTLLAVSNLEQSYDRREFTFSITHGRMKRQLACTFLVGGHSSALVTVSNFEQPYHGTALPAASLGPPGDVSLKNAERCYEQYTNIRNSCSTHLQVGS